MLRDQPPHDEIARLLAQRLEESGQPRQTRVTVAELHRVLLPYHECRDALGFATKAEYDVALLRFLERGDYVRIGEAELTEAVQQELSSPEPGLAFLRNFAAAQLQVRSPRTEASREETPPPDRGDDKWLEALEPTGGGEVANGAPDAANGAGGDGASVAEATRAGGEGSAGAGSTGPGGEGSAGGARAEERPARRAVHTEAAAQAPASCRGCGATLPSRAGLRFCPECGADQRALRCGRCGEELEAAWSYCPRCGAAAANGG